MISKRTRLPCKTALWPGDPRPLCGQGRITLDGAEDPAGLYGLTLVEVPPRRSRRLDLASVAGVGHLEGVMLGWLAKHPLATRTEALASRGSECRHRDIATAYDQLVTLRLIHDNRTSYNRTPALTGRGQEIVRQAEVAALVTEADMAQSGREWDHPANATQRWIITAYTGLQLLGWPYPDDGPDVTHLRAAWDAMTRAMREYLLDATLPVALTLRDLAVSGPLPLARAAAEVREWNTACGLTGHARGVRNPVGILRRAAGVGLLQVGIDPWAPDDSPDQELIGPARGWTLLAPVPDCGPALSAVEG